MNQSKKKNLIALTGVAFVLNHASIGFAEDQMKGNPDGEKENVSENHDQKNKLPPSFEALVKEPQGGGEGSSPSHNF